MRINKITKWNNSKQPTHIESIKIRTYFQMRAQRRANVELAWKFFRYMHTYVHTYIFWLLFWNFRNANSYCNIRGGKTASHGSCIIHTNNAFQPASFDPHRNTTLLASQAPALASFLRVINFRLGDTKLISRMKGDETVGSRGFYFVTRRRPVNYRASNGSRAAHSDCEY